MGDEKQKSETNDAVLWRSGQKRAREDDYGEETTVTDEEVEEFYAILRRIHVAVNYFKKGKGDIRDLTELEKAEWLSLGHNVEVKDGNNNIKEKENVGLDLNADPDTGSDPFKLELRV